MNTKKLASAFLGLLAATAFAQTPIGTITSVNGVATVTTGTVGTAISVGAPIVEGARVITTSTGSVTMRLANGCTASVPAGHAVTVRSNLTCQQLQAAVQPVTTTTTTTTATTTATAPAGTVFGVPSAGVALGFGALLAIGIISADDDEDDDQPVSAR